MEENQKSGKFRDKALQSWKNLRERCHNPNHMAYHNYGGRGITVGFGSFLEFYCEVGDPPTALHTIDRIDNNRGYEPGNVKWSSSKEQRRNSRQNIYVSHNGKTQILTDWALELGFPVRTLHSRLLAGDTGDLLFRPVKSDLLGKRFDRLLVIGYAGQVKQGNRSRPAWKCMCDCGNEKVIVEKHLTEKGKMRTQSCGCLAKEKAAALAKTLVLKRWAKSK
jgi:hypothetical protein